MSENKNVLVIMGSLRAGRVNPVVAKWVVELAQSHASLRCEIVDLADWPLPLDDEPMIPAVGQYVQAHTLAWSKKIGAADALIFVTPQYNWGYPAALKNAIDHLSMEWHHKPAIIVTYGGHGGTKCSEQLKQVAGGIKLRLISISPALILPMAVIREGAALEPARDFSQHAGAMHSALAELADLLT